MGEAVKLRLSDVPRAMVEAGAYALDPAAFDPPVHRGCQSPWHWQGHSYHSSCPACSGSWTTSESIERERRTRRRREARTNARHAIRAALVASEVGEGGGE